MQLINEKLNMWSCTLGELEYRQIKILNLALGENSKLADFESFFDDKTGQIILNKEYCHYDWAVENYTTYLEANGDERTKMWEKHLDDDRLCDLMDYLDTIDRKRKDFEILSILPEQSSLYSAEATRMFHILKESTDLEKIVSNLYTYGIIQGKREERAKKKAHK